MKEIHYCAKTLSTWKRYKYIKDLRTSHICLFLFYITMSQNDLIGISLQLPSMSILHLLVLDPFRSEVFGILMALQFIHHIETSFHI